MPTIGSSVTAFVTRLALEQGIEHGAGGIERHVEASLRAVGARAVLLATRVLLWVNPADEVAAVFVLDPRVGGDVEERAPFLRAGILTEEGLDRTTITGTPQGGVLSPLLANIALSALDQHFARKWEALGPSWKRARHRRAGVPTMRIVRYADDFVVMINGTQGDAEALRDEVSTVLARIGLRLSEEKTRVVHRRGVRLPRLAHSTPMSTRSERKEGGLHLPI